MLQRRVLVLCFVLVVILAGCEIFIREPPEEIEDIFLDRAGAVDVFIGPEIPGLVVSGGSFFVRAGVKNNGWPKINRGEMKFFLLGVNPQEYKVNVGEGALRCDGEGEVCSSTLGSSFCPCGKNNFDIIGRGGVGSFGFRLTSPNLPLAGDQSISIITRACYPYYTVSQSKICVGRPQISGLGGCDYSSSFDVKNTVAPYHISSLNQYFDEDEGGKIVLELDVSKVFLGVGSSYLPVDADCTDSSNFALTDRVRVSAIIIGNNIFVDRSDKEEAARVLGVLSQIHKNINVVGAKDLFGDEIEFREYNEVCEGGEPLGVDGNCPNGRRKVAIVDIFPGENGVLSFDYKPEGGITSGRQVENLVVLLEYGFYTQDSRSVTILAR